MQTLTVQITNSNALKLCMPPKTNNLLNILNVFELSSASLPGSALNLNAFKNWIANAENAQTVDIKEVKVKWASKRKQLVTKLSS